MSHQNLGFRVDFELARCDDGPIEGCREVQKFINFIYKLGNAKNMV